jgi:hypothetical protein
MLEALDAYDIESHDKSGVIVCYYDGKDLDVILDVPGVIAVVNLPLPVVVPALKPVPPVSFREDKGRVSRR